MRWKMAQILDFFLGWWDLRNHLLSYARTGGDSSGLNSLECDGSRELNLPRQKQTNSLPYNSRLTEARAILRRQDERTHHLRREWVTIELVQFSQPVDGARCVRITP